MSKSMRRSGWLLVALLAIAQAGCLQALQKAREAAARADRVNDFKLFAIVCHNYHDSNGAFPPDWSAAIAFDSMAAPVLQKLQAQGVVVAAWNAELREMVNGTSNTLLAYEAQAPTAGGIVAMCDGSVRIIAPGEFGQFSLPPAGASSSAPAPSASEAPAEPPVDPGFDPPSPAPADPSAFEAPSDPFAAPE